MKNKITGWLLFGQLTYVAVFVVLFLIDALSRGAVRQLFGSLRNSVGLPNTYLRLSDYLTAPLVMTAPINVVLTLIFFWPILRRGTAIDFTKDGFCLFNAVYVAASGWIIMALFFQKFR